MALKFSEKTMKEFEGILARYPRPDAAVLPALWLAQREFGFISTGAALYVAEITKTPPAKVLETLKFYTMYRERPGGRFHLQVCRTLSCMLAGSEDLLRAAEKRLKIRAGGVTKDGTFSLGTVECLAGCHNAPCVRVNDETHEQMSVEKLEKLLDELQK